MGDLVYCKEQETDKEIASSPLEFEDGSDNVIPDDIHLEDTSIVDLPEVRTTSVKVMFYEFYLNYNLSDS